MKALLILLVCPFTTLAAQDSAEANQPLTHQEEHTYRDPGKARVLAMILPGAGYAYTGEYVRAYETWVITATGVMIGPLWVSSDCSILTWNCNRASRLVNILSGGFLAAAAAVTWVRSVRDAPKSAERANERHRRRELKLRPTISVPESHKGVNAGLSVAW
ncbi:MAG TPA: hypothetical protein VJS39_08710 [Gemmatimonadaceae bacterium]|nr:hypothetical protein [Gemmatimonadaceae bacterium]